MANNLGPGSGGGWGWLDLALQDKIYPVESPLPKDRPPPEEPIIEQDAEIRWGKASQFNYGSRQGPNIKYQASVKWPADDDEDDNEIPTLTYTELEGGRKVTKIRVTAEGDEDIWVDVERIDEIVFQGPASLTDSTVVNHHYILKHPPPKESSSGYTIPVYEIPVAPLGHL